MQAGVPVVDAVVVGHFSQGVVSYGNCTVVRVFLVVRLGVDKPLGCRVAVYGRDRHSGDSRPFVGNHNPDGCRPLVCSRRRNSSRRRSDRPDICRVVVVFPSLGELGLWALVGVREPVVVWLEARSA